MAFSRLQKQEARSFRAPGFAGSESVVDFLYAASLPVTSQYATARDSARFVWK